MTQGDNQITKISHAKEKQKPIEGAIMLPCQREKNEGSLRTLSNRIKLLTAGKAWCIRLPVHENTAAIQDGATLTASNRALVEFEAHPGHQE